MMRQAFRRPLFILFFNLIPLWLAAPLSTAAATGMVNNVESNIESNIASIVPSPEEDKWLTIPWHTNLMQARLEAQQQNRPLFLWVMNGNPLGCT